jgi:UDP-GlcNAc3NAcA epimerase
LKIVTVLGARPQFIKSAPVSIELKRNGIEEILVHTGQHFDENMSDIFFSQLNIAKPAYQLNINSLKHGAMTGKMLEKIEEILSVEKPDYTLVYGDTNSTLAGALAASKLGIRVIHIEAGLRSFNNSMPEEINRIIADRLSYYLFCPTDNSVLNLEMEGFNNFNKKIIKSGDVMQDAAIMFTGYAQKPEIDIPDNFILCTLHRQENTDNEYRLKSILTALDMISEKEKIIFSVHPRTLMRISEYNIELKNKINLQIIQPVGYFEMLYLLKNCSLVMTDSGGLQKEAFFFRKLCLTLREETEWIELVENGFNFIAGSDSEKIYNLYELFNSAAPDFDLNLYGNGEASEIIVKELIG